MKKKKILIVGSSANTYSLAKYFATKAGRFEIFAAPGNKLISEYATRVDIRENNVAELLKYAITNDIDLTVAVSKEAIRADIATDFRENSQLIFAPGAECSNFATSRAAAKKFMYKQHISIPKFGIFEKTQLALDYVKDAQYPLLITSDTDNENSVRAVCNSVQNARICINDIFGMDEDRVVIEEYIYGHPFTLYVITDGYQTLPICAVGDYRFMEDGEGGLYTQGVGAYAPDYKVSFDTINKILNKEVSTIVTSFQKRGKPYLGILGIEAVLKEDESYIITGFTPFFKDHDSDLILSLLDSDLYEIMEACANDSFADDYEEILTNSLSAVSCVLSSRIDSSVISGLDTIEDDRTHVSHFGTKTNNYFEYLTNKGRTMVITQTASTISRAKNLLYENIENINFEGKRFRKDICAD